LSFFIQIVIANCVGAVIHVDLYLSSHTTEVKKMFTMDWLCGQAAFVYAFNKVSHLYHL